jgi:hypothetical protein
MSSPFASYDSPWKELLDQHLREALEFFFPDVAAEIDWSQDWVSLESEVRELSGEGEIGVRLADRFVKFRTLAGDDNYLHVEVQGKPEKGLPRRVYVYGYRADDRFGVPVDHLVILADDDANWRPTTYEVVKKRSRLTLTFQPVKVLDWAGREEELLAHENPAALFGQAHLWSRQTRDDDEARLNRKLTLIRTLVSRKLDASEMQQWYRYLDWLLPLTAARRAEYHRLLDLMDQEGKMPFVSDLEQRAEDRAEAKVAEKIVGLEKDRDRVAQALRDTIVQIAQSKFGSAEGLAEALAGKPLDVLEAVSKDIWQVAGLADLLAHIP